MNVSDDHLTELLGCYAAGLTSAAEDELVERHLLVCQRCLDEYDSVAQVAWDLTSYAGPRSEPRTRPAGSMVRSRRRRARPANEEHRRPGERAGRPGRTMAFAAAVVLVIVGATVGVWLRGGNPASPPVVTELVASATDEGTGVGAVVVLTQGRGEVGIRVTARGLEPGASYQLLLIPYSGDRVVVAEWTAVDPTQVIRGTVRVPLADVRLFGIGRTDGTILLSVPFGRGTPSPPSAKPGQPTT